MARRCQTQTRAGLKISTHGQSTDFYKTAEVAKRRHLCKNQPKFRFILAACTDRLQIFGSTARLACVVVVHFVYYRYLPSELAVSENDRRFPRQCGEWITLAVDLINCAGDQYC